MQSANGLVLVATAGCADESLGETTDGVSPPAALPVSVVRRVFVHRRAVQFLSESHVRVGMRRLPKPRQERTRALCLPLIQGSAVVGMVCVERNRRQRFTGEQLRLGALLGRQATATIDIVERHAEELKAMQAKVNPPFLHNSLSVIAELVRSDPAKAEEAILMLSRLYRYVLESSAQRIVTLQQELEMSRDYLALEKHRLGERLHAEVMVDGPTERIHVPCLLLQTIVENLVSYGVADKVGRGHVRIGVSVSHRYCLFRVEDDGPAWQQRAVRAEPGLRAVRQRLALHYPRAHSFKLLRRHGVAVEVRISRQGQRADNLHQSKSQSVRARKE